MRRLLPLLGLLACAEARPLGYCEVDDTCAAPGTRCDLETKQCVCKSDEACAEGELCNSAGACQRRPGCVSNRDCAALSGTFCDLETGSCLSGPAPVAGGACGLASHCPFGTLCASGVCAAGCHDDGDCPLGGICSNGSCATNAGLCSDDSFCGYKERCAQNTCRKDRRGPYCRGCSPPTGLNPSPCDDAKNFCLVNSAETGGFRQFCGVDCSLGQPCPNGYACYPVTILTRDICRSQAECQCDPRRIRWARGSCRVNAPCDRPEGCVVARHPSCNPGGGGVAACVVATGTVSGSCTCDGDEDCELGGACVGGRCCTGTVDTSRQCVGGEGDVSGFCTCATDEDCPRDSCDLARGVCAITGTACTPGGGECGAISCIGGACLIGRNCAPVEGLSCSVVGQ